MFARIMSSPGRKVVSALTGLFLTFFLVTHVSGNLLLLMGDDGQAFNEYAEFMSTSPVIAVASALTYLSIISHIIMALALVIRNRLARGPRSYAVKAATPWSRFMGVLGLVLTIFLGIHLAHIWFPFRFGSLPLSSYDGLELRNIYGQVAMVLSKPYFVLLYVGAAVAVGFHLDHGGQSALRSLGLSSPRSLKKAQLLLRSFALVLTFGFVSIALGLYIRSV